MNITKNLNKLLLIGTFLIGGSMNGSCSQTQNSLLTSNSAAQFGKDYTSGKVEDANLILKFTKEILEKGTISAQELMKNLDIFYYYSPSIPEVQIACNQTMVDLANEIGKGLKGTSAYKIVYILYQSLFDTSHRFNPNKETIESLIGRFNALVNGDRKLAYPLRKEFAKVLSEDPDFSIYGFSSEWE